MNPRVTGIEKSHESSGSSNAEPKKKPQCLRGHAYKLAHARIKPGKIARKEYKVILPRDTIIENNDIDLFYKKREVRSFKIRDLL